MQEIIEQKHDIKKLVSLVEFKRLKRLIKSLMRRFAVLKVTIRKPIVISASSHHIIAPHAKHQENVIEYGNQPCTHFAHLFNYVGAPWLAQKWSREVMKAAKSDITPYGGYGGDEDQGMMGSLNTLMAIGLFAMRGGCEADPVYDITSPLFDRITIHLTPESTFTIETQNNTPENIYIQSATLNGQSHDRAWFRHSDLINGGTLILTLGPEPNTEWGTQEPPPSMTV